MNMPVIDDPRLPGLRLAAHPALLARSIDDTLRKETADAWRCNDISVKRFRYRAGSRAILQVILRLTGPDGARTDRPGALWLFNGNKAWDAAADAAPPSLARPPAMIFEPRTAGVLTLFPYDRRVPEIANFAERPDAFAIALTGSEATEAPELSRYRPGLGATFRWQMKGGLSFIKIFNDRPAHERFLDLDRAAACCPDRALAIPAPLGFSDEIGAVAIRGATGRPLAAVLADDAGGNIGRAIDVVMSGFEALNRLEIRPNRSFGVDALLKRGRTAVHLIAAADRHLGARAEACLKSLARHRPALRSSPTHMDLKIEHVLLDGSTACLLDLDSLAMSDPLYDPAMLAARVELSGMMGDVLPAACQLAFEALRDAAPSVAAKRKFDWLLSVARFQTARFVIQNGCPDWRAHVGEMMTAISTSMSEPILTE